MLDARTNGHACGEGFKYIRPLIYVMCYVNCCGDRYVGPTG